MLRNSNKGVMIIWEKEKHHGETAEILLGQFDLEWKQEVFVIPNETAFCTIKDIQRWSRQENNCSVVLG